MDGHENCMDRFLDEWMEMDGRMNKRMDSWMDGRTD